MSRIQTYDPKDIICGFAGQILGGYGPEVVRVQRVNPTWVDDIGADQEVVRVNQNDRRGIIVVTLLQSSASNLLLTSLQLADEATGLTISPFQITDLRGLDLHIAPKAWIEGPPTNITYDKTVQTREWTFRTNDLRMFVGGTAQAA